MPESKLQTVLINELLSLPQIFLALLWEPSKGGGLLPEVHRHSLDTQLGEHLEQGEVVLLSGGWIARKLVGL